METDFVLCEVGTEVWSFTWTNCVQAMPWFGKLLDGFSPRRHGSSIPNEPMRFSVDKVTLGQVFLWVLQFSPLYIIPTLLSTHLYLHGSRTRRTNGLNPANFPKKKKSALSEIGSIDYKIMSLFKTVLLIGMGSTLFIYKVLNCNFAAHDWIYLYASLRDRV